MAEASNPVLRRHFDQRRLSVMADILVDLIATLTEMAFVRHIDRTGDLALQRDPLRFLLQVRNRNSREQGSGIGMDGISE